jgi:hypothetical protein
VETTPSATSTCGRSALSGGRKRARPNRHHGRGVVRVRDVGEKVIRVVERDEAFRVPGRDEDARRVVDADHLIQRRVHDQHRPSQGGNGLLDVDPLNRIKEPSANEEGPTGNLHRGLALARDGVQIIRSEEAQDMLKVGRRTNRRYRRNIRHVGGGYDRSGATQAVPDEEGR